MDALAQSYRHRRPDAPITGSAAGAIAASAEAPIREGLLKSGAPLRTVRELAGRLGTSPATVNSAYRTLRERGLIVAEGRRGTRVAPRPPLRVPTRSSSAGSSARAGLRDLTIGLRDPELLPPIEPALQRVNLESRLK